MFSTPDFQSPVRGDPDDLLLLPGAGFAAGDVVVYQYSSDPTQALSAPATVPTASDDVSGVAPVVNADGVPHSLVVRLPAQMQMNRSYTLWVRNLAGEWSNGVRINDARPLWLTPAIAYATAHIAALPRELKIVGRNLQPATGAVTEVELSGPADFILNAIDEGDVPLAHYVARVSLPAYIPPGNYQVRVRRDGHGWVALSGQTLTVRADSAGQSEFSIADYGCQPNDAVDDTRCILLAIATARAYGGIVTFGAGVWNLIDSTTPGLVHGEGIVVPVGVSLRGAGASLTVLARADSWGTPATPGRTEATLTLQGSNVVSGFRFVDEHVYTPTDSPMTFLKLGKRFDRVNRADPSEPTTVDDVVIAENVFDRPWAGIGDGGLPIRRLFVTYNEIGAYARGFAPGGYGNNVANRFRIEDSVIAHNTFKPGSFMDVAAGSGAIASELGASTRVDFSDNVADGASIEFLNSPNDARGWRAAYFWHLRDNHEMLLLSRNVATCTGDKVGDGEAMALDDNHNSYALSRAEPIVAASANTVTVSGALRGTHEGRAVDVSTYYLGNWLHIAEGKGMGQVRRIVAYSIDQQNSRVTFTVAPQWDVQPVAGDGRATVGRIYWQVYGVDNVVDHRQPLCLKSNRTRSKGGQIDYHGRTSDSVLAGNRQYDTDGILLPHTYKAIDASCSECIASVANQKTFIEVRGNLVAGEYNWPSDCSWSGISGWISAVRLATSPPPVLGYGVSIGHNRIVSADGLRGGAISYALGWFAGPPPNDWPMVDGTVVFHNEIEDLPGPKPVKCSSAAGAADATRFGVNLDHAMAWRSTLYGNTCVNVATPLRDAGSQTKKVCPLPTAASSCECVGVQ